jgi:nitrilase
MPLYRQHLYQQGVELYCAPTVDTRDSWQIAMRHIANEGRCFVLSPCQWLVESDWPEDLREHGGLASSQIEGRSLIVSPFGEVLAGPPKGEGMVSAEVDLDEIMRAKFDLDVAGHSSRPDIFKLTVSS